MWGFLMYEELMGTIGDRGRSTGKENNLLVDNTILRVTVNDREELGLSRHHQYRITGSMRKTERSKEWHIKGC